MPNESVALPGTDAAQIQEWNRMLQLASPALGSADGKRMELPGVVFRFLKDIARNMQLGRAVVLVPENQRLTGQRAADLLGVSQQHLIKLLQQGDLPGTHRKKKSHD